MTECLLRQHQWEPREHSATGYESIELVCKNCGVGHRLEMTQLPNGEVRVDTTIFPATGEKRISREIIQWSMFTCEGTIQQMQRDGIVVVRGEIVIEGETPD